MTDTPTSFVGLVGAIEHDVETTTACAWNS